MSRLGPVPYRRARRRGAIAVLAALAVAAATAPVATGVRAVHADSGGYYVALGDSYSSGEGLEPYDHTSGSCRRSQRGAYPQVAAAAAPADGYTFRFHACSGARTHDVTGEGEPEGEGQVDAVAGVAQRVRLVTVTIGGNDARFSEVLGYCVLGARSCAERYADEEQFIEDEVRPKLRATYQSLREASAPARMVVLTYPQIFQAERECRRDPGIDNDEKRWIRARTDQLDDVIVEEAEGAGLEVLDVRDAFEGHEICTHEPYASGWGESGTFHPNAKGHEVLGRRLVDFLAPS